MTPGYSALHSGAAWLDLSARGRIRVTGEDRVRLLHAMASNDVQHLGAGSGCYTFFLNAQGRILADAILLSMEDHLLLDVEPESRRFVFEHLDKYIIADDVALEDVTDATVEIAIEGAAGAVPEALPDTAYSHVRQGDTILVRASATGMPGYRVIAPAAGREEIIRESGAAPATAEDARVVRLEHGIPRFGEDFSDRHLVHETQLLHGVHFNKGCYLGQEIVERVRSRGGVHRLLVRLAADREVAPGAKLAFEGTEVGEVTSAVFSPAAGRVVGLGYIRLGAVPAGAKLRAGDAEVEITATRPGL